MERSFHFCSLTTRVKSGWAAILEVSSSYSGPKPLLALLKLALVPVMVLSKKFRVKRTADLEEATIVFRIISFLGSLAFAVGRNPYFRFSEVLFPSIFMALLYS